VYLNKISKYSYDRDSFKFKIISQTKMADKACTVLKMSNQSIHIIFSDKTEVIFDDNSTAIILTKDLQILKSNITNNFHSYFSLAKHNASLKHKLIFAKDLYAKMGIRQAIEVPSTSRTVAKTILKYCNANRTAEAYKSFVKKPVSNFTIIGHHRTNTSTSTTTTKKENDNKGAVAEIRKKMSKHYFLLNPGVQRRNHPLEHNSKISRQLYNRKAVTRNTQRDYQNPGKIMLQ
jgi:hypothetical protein